MILDQYAVATTSESSWTYALGLSVVTRTNLLPSRATTFKVTEGLSQLEGLNNNTLLLLVVTDLSVTSKREVLAERVAVETVVGHDATEIGVSNEEDTEQVVDLTLVPVGTVVETAKRRDRSSLVGVGLDANTGVVADGKHVVDNLEALVAGRVVDSGNVADLGEFGGGVVLEEVEDGKDGGGGNVDDELILPDREPERSVSILVWRLQRRSVRTAGCTWACKTSSTGRTGAGCRPFLDTCRRG